jgi:hypothetical protein
MIMSDPFNAYYAWLGIPPEECHEGGPHYYQLLGLRVFEKDPQAIDAAARRTIATLSRYATGLHGDLTERLLVEVGAAAACLRNPMQKAEYDRALASGEPLEMAAATEVAAYVHRLLQRENLPPDDEYGLQPLEGPGADTSRPAHDADTSGATLTYRPVRRISSAGLIMPTIMAVVGGIVGLIGGYFIMYYLLGEDLLRLLPPRDALLRLAK